MNKTRGDGGMAFPWQEVCNDGKGKTVVCDSYPGMSLRDWYAGKFAAAWTIALSQRYKEDGYTDEGCAVEANRLGLIQADKMITKP